jgi:ankyrin repeat protein
MKLVRVEGEDINAHTTQDFSILDYAIGSRSPAAWQYLFEQGAKFDAAKSARDRVLFSFITTPSDVLLKSPPFGIETYRMQITHGANLEPKNAEGQTPLILAAKMGDAAAVHALIEAKANVGARDSKEATALVSAVSRNVVESAKMLLAISEGASMTRMFSAVEKSDKSPATANRLAIVRTLIEGGVDVNAADKEGDTALHKATQMGDVEVIGLLLASAADVNARTKTGRTALMTAAVWSFAECTSALLAAGADVELSTQDGKTAMSIARDNKHTEVLKLLEASRRK